MANQSEIYYVENPTVRAWLLSIWPRLFWGQLRARSFGIRCYAILGYQLAMSLAKISSGLCGTKVDWLEFRYIDIWDRINQVGPQSEFTGERLQPTVSIS